MASCDNCGKYVYICKIEFCLRDRNHYCEDCYKKFCKPRSFFRKAIDTVKEKLRQ